MRLREMCLRHPRLRGEVHHWQRRDANQQDRVDVPCGEM